MADFKISDLGSPSGGIASADLFEIVDVSDTTDAASGSSKAVTLSALVTGGLPTQTGNSGKALSTDGAGALSWIAVGMTNPMSASGDIIYGGSSGTPTRLAKGTDTQVLTLASGVPSWADAASGGGVPAICVAYVLDTYASGQTTSSKSASATITYGLQSVSLTTGSSANGFSGFHYDTFINPGYNYFAGSATFSARVSPDEASATADGIVCMGGNGSMESATPTYTARHLGFRFRMVTGTCKLTCTNADGTTATTTDVTITAGDRQFVTAKKTGTTNIKYYSCNTTSATITLRATHTTNLPGDGADAFGATFNVTNGSTATDTQMQVHNASIVLLGDA